ncbi:uncharacterized protein LOC123309587 isoform X1 [Coccinella septempunctata]|uniref:uncharacterized protein LOC123309587 isoform X1 n=1 Tax=Coccinella septempunctata TaxID=41139 RepID=UPI001D090937|nr:uncharacterized protein LOC123309587 isoform X1 [Coccinella septempunctata]
MNDKFNDGIIRRLPAEIGRRLMDINLEKAMVYLDEGVEALPEERYCLLGRATARTRALDIFGAAEDIEVLLKLYPCDLTAHALNNDIEYLNLNFEKALILNGKYLKQRKFPPHFFLGYMKCMDAIMNSLTRERAGHPLRDHYKIIRKKAWTEELNRPLQIRRDNKKSRVTDSKESSRMQVNTVESREIADISSETVGDGSLRGFMKIDPRRDASLADSLGNKNPSSLIPKLIGFPYEPLQKRTTNLANYMSEKYLGQLFEDKRFLEKIPNRKGFIAPNIKAEDKLKKLVKNVNVYLNKAQGLMRSTRPFYHIKYQERKSISETKTGNENLYQRQNEEAEKYFEKILDRLNTCFDANDLKGMIVLISNMTDYYHRRFPKYVIRSQYSHIAEAMNFLRDGYFHIGLFSENMTLGEKITRAQVRLGMVMETSPSNDSFFNNLRQYNSINWAPNIKLVEEQLKKSMFPEEIIYFNFQLAKLYLDNGKLELVKRHAKKSLFVARELKDKKWVVNINFLLIQAYIKQNNKMDSIKLLERNLLLAKIMSYEKLIYFLNFAIQLVNETDFYVLSSPIYLMRKRKKQILKLLHDDERTKRRVEMMFKKMSYSPVERTLPIIPGVKLTLPVTKRKQEERNQTLTRRYITSKASKMSKVSYKRRGVECYDLVKDYIDLEES